MRKPGLRIDLDHEFTRMNTNGRPTNRHRPLTSLRAVHLRFAPIAHRNDVTYPRKSHLQLQLCLNYTMLKGCHKGPPKIWNAIAC